MQALSKQQTLWGREEWGFYKWFLSWPKKGGSREGKLVRAFSQMMVMRGKCKLLTAQECAKELMLCCVVGLADIWIPIQDWCSFQTRDFLTETAQNRKFQNCQRLQPQSSLWSLMFQKFQDWQKTSLTVITMFVQDIETFSVLHNCWLTILSHPFNFLTTWCTFLYSIRISTVFYCRCVMFAVGGDPILRVQKYHNIETVVMLGHNGFGWKMMTVWRAYVMQMSRFQSCLRAKFCILPSRPIALHLSL